MYYHAAREREVVEGIKNAGVPFASHPRAGGTHDERSRMARRDGGGTRSTELRESTCCIPRSSAPPSSRGGLGPPLCIPRSGSSVAPGRRVVRRAIATGMARTTARILETLDTLRRRHGSMLSWQESCFGVSRSESLPINFFSFVHGSARIGWRMCGVWVANGWRLGGGSCRLS